MKDQFVVMFKANNQIKVTSPMSFHDCDRMQRLVLKKTWIEVHGGKLMSKEVEKTNANPLTTGQQARGFEEPITKEDIIFPKAMLLQSTSEHIQNGVEGLKIGMIINNLTREVLPEKFIPIFKFTNWIRSNPRKKDDPNFDSMYEPGKIIWRSTDPNDPKVIEEGQFGPNGEVPKATKFINFFCKFVGVDMPIILSFARTSEKAGKKLYSTAKLLGGDMFSKQYKLASRMKEKDGTKYYVLEAAPAGITDKEDYAVAEKWYNDFRNIISTTKIHQEGEEITEPEEKL